MKFALCNELRYADPQFLHQHNVANQVAMPNIVKPQFDARINFQVYKKQQQLNQHFRQYADEVTYRELVRRFIESANSRSNVQQCIQSQSIALQFQLKCDLSFDQQLAMLMNSLQLQQERCYMQYSREYARLDVAALAGKYARIVAAVRQIQQYSVEQRETSQNFQQLLTYRTRLQHIEQILTLLSAIADIRIRLAKVRATDEQEALLQTYNVASRVLKQYQAFFQLYNLSSEIDDWTTFRTECAERMSCMAAEQVFRQLESGTCEYSQTFDTIIDDAKASERLLQLVQQQAGSKNIDSIIGIIKNISALKIGFAQAALNYLFELLENRITTLQESTTESIMELHFKIVQINLPAHVVKLLELQMAKLALFAFQADQNMYFTHQRIQALVGLETMTQATRDTVQARDQEWCKTWLTFSFKNNKSQTAFAIISGRQYNITVTALRVIEAYFLRWHQFQHVSFKAAQQLIEIDLLDGSLLNQYFQSICLLLQKNPGLREMQLALDICDFIKAALTFLQQQSGHSVADLISNINTQRVFELLFSALELTIDEQFKVVFDVPGRLKGFSFMSQGAIAQLVPEDAECVHRCVVQLVQTMQTVLKSFKSANEASCEAKRRVYDWFLVQIDAQLRGFIRKQGGRIGVMNSKVVLRNKLEFCRMVLRFVGEHDLFDAQDYKEIVEQWDATDASDL